MATATSGSRPIQSKSKFLTVYYLYRDKWYCDLRLGASWGEDSNVSGESPGKG